MDLATPTERRTARDQLDPPPCPLCGSTSCADEVEAYLYRMVRGRDPSSRPEGGGVDRQASDG
jgi:hypothetical protein